METRSSSQLTKFSRQRFKPSRVSCPAALELLALLPERETATLLLNTYFDRVHWFMLVFHQDEFRSKFNRLYDSRYDLGLVTTHEYFGFTSTLLAAFVIALQHVGTYRRDLLLHAGVDLEDLKQGILGILRAKLLDLLSLSSLEVVQTCVLLGSYYLYHGDPKLAWPICGCGLRIAQSLNLHRSVLKSLPPSERSAKSFHRRNEARKRCWWAIFEIETFCSMLYGYPLSISDKDCDIELPDPSITPQTERLSQSQERGLNNDATLLSYKYLMSKLSIIIKTALTDLYGVCQQSVGKSERASSRNQRLQQLVQSVAELDHRLQHWDKELPSILRLKKARVSNSTYDSLNEIEMDIGASGEKFENHIFQLQAMALKLAFENARILIHRPLISYKLTAHPSSWATQPFTLQSSQVLAPFQNSIQKCRDAALQTADVGSYPIFLYTPTTYAAAFVGMHLFTAGVTLCIMTSLDPLSMQSHESKIGVHRLMQMQLSLQETSILVAQGFSILKKLAVLIMQKETEKLFEFSRPPTHTGQPAQTLQPMPYLPRSPCNGANDTRINAREPSAALPLQIDSAAPQQNQTQAAAFEGMTNKAFPTRTPENFNIDFDENPTVAETLLNLDQGTPPEIPALMETMCLTVVIVMYEFPNHSSTEDDGLPSYSDLSLNSGLIDQEQGWIWGFDYFRNDEEDCIELE
ncbi:hypothetical protein H2198_003038 [Neophaeococcomyces mojaviensis]|uniref:Uncharacterized protein n=1 Tax=Neophaeococcomyces mojaviensis TaxID=3383035 RepID=A0ACC3ACI7_9EURO|nr:hypothetical protein H2198_003038 [Knufia sp. JES_112]